MIKMAIFSQKQKKRGLSSKKCPEMSERGMIGTKKKRTKINIEHSFSHFKENKRQKKFKIFMIFTNAFDLNSPIHCFGEFEKVMSDAVKWIIGSFNKYHWHDILLDGLVMRDACVYTMC